MLEIIEDFILTTRELQKSQQKKSWKPYCYEAVTYKTADGLKQHWQSQNHDRLRGNCPASENGILFSRGGCIVVASYANFLKMCNNENTTRD